MAAPVENIRLEDVHLTLTGGSGPVNVLRGLDLAVCSGETVSVVGPSGSGKTSMLMVMSGMLRPTSGRAVIDGTDLAQLDEDAAARFRRKRIGIVFQGFHLVPTMTALENTALPLEFARIPDPMARAAESLERVGLGARSGHYPSQLSGGEQQRVAIARAFAPQPSILLADEPTGNLDGDTGKMVLDILLSLQSELNTTLVLVTHDPKLAKRTDRIVSMNAGRLEQVKSDSEVRPSAGGGVDAVAEAEIEASDV